MKAATENSRSAFRTTITAVRNKLLADIATEADHRYSLGAKDRSKIRLRSGEAADWAILEPEIENLDELIREKAYTTANRLAFLFLLEARGLRPVLVLKGTTLSPIRDNQEFFAALMDGADQGWTYFLDQVWDSLSLELPALFTRTRLQDALPVPGLTLVWLINEFAKAELAEVWLDDTTPGWLFQYWNDPDRKAIDEKLQNTTSKVESSDLAHKTQLFTERYMVEWLVQNSLGTQWLALCKKRNWEYSINKDNDFWRFYVEQDVSPELIKAVPDKLEDIKILDPAMGSGHFLMYTFDYLYLLYKDEDRFSGLTHSNEEIVDLILENNLHGIDIDNRAVQIAAASLFIKARTYSPEYKLKKMNLVASDLGLAKISDSDPSLQTFVHTMKTQAGLTSSLSLRIFNCLKTADYMGSLLQVNEEINRISDIFSHDKNLTRTILIILSRFIQKHDAGEDLGVQSLAEQMQKGMRLIEILGTPFDLVIANPPYLGLGKVIESISDAFQKDYECGKADMYSIFILRGLNLLKKGGVSAMVTPRGWMFISQFEEMRKKILTETQFRICGDLHLGAFSDMKDVSVTMFVIQNSKPKKNVSIFVRPVQKQEIRRDQYQVEKNTQGLISQDRTNRFPQERFADIPGSPMIYWWPEEFRQAYLKVKKLGAESDPRQGLATSNNDRYLRKPFEVSVTKIEINDSYEKKQNRIQYIWQPFVKGANGRRWFEEINDIIRWEQDGLEVKTYASYLYGSASRTIKSQDKYFFHGIAFNSIGSNFLCRLWKYRSVFNVSGASIFSDNSKKLQVLLSSSLSNYVIQSLNPTINNEIGDIENLPVLDYIADYQSYLDRARALYDELFASTETNIEYRYHFLESERFEVEEARIRDEIDKEILAHFSTDTVKAIYEEIGESPFDYPAREPDFVPDGFADAYQTSDSILELAHQYRLHPDYIIDIKNTLGLVHQSLRQKNAFQHLSWAIGVLLGRFDADTGGLADSSGPGIAVGILEKRASASQDWNGKPGAEKSANADFSAGPQGLIYLTALDDDEGFKRPLGRAAGKESIEALRAILEKKHGREGMSGIWSEIERALVEADGRANVGEWIRLDAFARHKELYENRPIYFPIVSARKNFFVWVNIHRWNDGTLSAILANYLKPDRDMLEARVRGLREDIVQTTDKRTRVQLEDAVYEYGRLHEELAAFADLVTRIAERGPDPSIQEAEAAFVMDLDDGVMVNSAALWELVQGEWKDPKKWWVTLSAPAGKKDFDWSHLAMRYWPKRVFEKVKKDPSLAVAHSDYGAYKGKDLFAKLHPAAAKKWNELQGKKIEEKFVRRDNGELEF